MMLRKISVLFVLIFSFCRFISAVPSLTAPSQGQCLNTSKPAFQWTADVGSDGYNICFSASVDFSGASTYTVVPNLYLPSSGLSDGRYFWRVRSYTGADYSAWSSTGEFVVDITSPSFSILQTFPAAFSPFSASGSTTTAASFLLNDVSTIAVSISGPFPSEAIVRNVSDEIIYFNDFNSDALSVWTNVAIDTWAVINDPVYPGEKTNLRVLSVYEKDSGNPEEPNGRIAYGNTNWKDYSVEADCKLTSNGNRAGILIRVQSIYIDMNVYNKYYEFALNYNSGRVELNRVENLAADPNPYYSSMSVSRNKWYKLKVSVTGSNIRCYVDGVLKIYRTDENINSGKAGLFGQTSSTFPVYAAYFDNFSVTKLGQIWNGRKDDSSLAGEGIYTFKITARDLAGNTTEAFTTVTVDTTTPLAVTDLSATLNGAGAGEVKLSWTAPYDNFGITQYIVKYASFQIDGTNWNLPTVSTYTHSWTPLGFGSFENRLAAGLTAATTYFFAIKCLDAAQNQSTVSNSPVIMTNANPSVTVITPTGGINIGSGDNSSASTLYSVNWIHTDPNPGDTHTFEIRLSSWSTGQDFGGVSDYSQNRFGDNYYGILVASGIPSGTTFYLMNTRYYEDSSTYLLSPPPTYRLLVLSRDSHGGDGWAISGPPDFNILNWDFPLSVTLASPNGGESWFGPHTLTWSVQDDNTWEIPYIKYDLYISTLGLVPRNSGNWQLIVSGIKGASYEFGTGTYENSVKCAIRIEATGADSPWRKDSLSWPIGESSPRLAYDFSNSTFSIFNTNKPPNSFSLLAPSKGGVSGALRPVFSWASTTDSDSGDAVTYYELWISTVSSFSPRTTISSITANSWTATYDLQDNKRYYWKVRAYDRSLNYRESAETDWYFTTNRKLTVSGDGKFTVTLAENLPSTDMYVYVGTITAAQSPALIFARQKLKENSSVRSITDIAYNINIMQNGSDVTASNPISATISIDSPYSIDSNGYLDYIGIPAHYLKIARLDETENKWVLASQNQTVDTNIAARKATVSVTVSHFSTYGLIAYAAPDSNLFSVGNFPNPFNCNSENTVITYGLIKDSKVTMEIFNLVGDLVYQKTIPAPSFDATGMTKNYEQWSGVNGDGLKVATGMYICRITAEPKDGGAKIVQLRKIGVKNK